VRNEFLQLADSLEPSFQRLMSAPPKRISELGAPARVPGVYLLSEGNRHLYVGRSNHIRNRMAGHSTPSAAPGTAAFAFRLAREATDNLHPSYKKGGGTRSELMARPDFRREFDNAKARIREMEVRTVEEAHPVRQALLEIYAATVLATPYNSFDNH
jgi:hypothetical protein